MPVIVYQSFNSNCSKTHGVSSAKDQRFTRDTQRFMNASVGQKRKLDDDGGSNKRRKVENTLGSKLIPPINPALEPTDILQGPSQAVPIAADNAMDRGSHTDSWFLNSVQQKVRGTHQFVFREFQKNIDVFALGEIDGGNNEWLLVPHVGDLVRASSSGKACNSISAFSSRLFEPNDDPKQPRVQLPVNTNYVGDDHGWLAMQVEHVNVAFVHVPNNIAKSESDCRVFYHAINEAFKSKGLGNLDVVMGDTNQSRATFTADVLGSGFKTAEVGPVTPRDLHNSQFRGTNSNAECMYDVAVYNSKTIQLRQCCYLSQLAGVSGKSYALTDHMGVAIDVKKLFPK